MLSGEQIVPRLERHGSSTEVVGLRPPRAVCRGSIGQQPCRDQVEFQKLGQPDPDLGIDSFERAGGGETVARPREVDEVALDLNPTCIHGEG